MNMTSSDAYAKRFARRFAWRGALPAPARFVRGVRLRFYGATLAMLGSAPFIWLATGGLATDRLAVILIFYLLFLGPIITYAGRIAAVRFGRHVEKDPGEKELAEKSEGTGSYATLNVLLVEAAIAVALVGLNVIVSAALLLAMLVLPLWVNVTFTVADMALRVVEDNAADNGQPHRVAS